jgi:protein-S-isoprenylcysteine O-methyltransferase Ste14
MANVLLIFLSFAFLHSLTISRRFKDLVQRALGRTFMQAWYRFLFTMLSVITVSIAFGLMRRVPDSVLWTAPEVLRWPLHGLQAAAVLFGAMAFQHLDGLEFLGVKQVWRYLVRREVAGNIEGLTQKDLVTTGVYGIVRHPLYVAGMVFVTFNPHITVNGLAFTILADLYFLFGMFIEERRFVKIFGEQYREYMKQVPRMLPRVFAR